MINNRVIGVGNRTVLINNSNNYWGIINNE